MSFPTTTTGVPMPAASPAAATGPTADVIVVSELRKRFGSVHAVDGVDFVVHKGEIFGLLGPNGAGKTTTIEMLEGIQRADAGHLRVLGLDPAREAPRL
ncbi:MAG TPA: ATP-binding cassette domain-containing protein, partial [Candidatus Sulfotelmatobacter sp.]|nr:ATP-binding cassette domain-containing protein [Candidatus Sulfotelmatobacter sp.]